MAATNPDLRGDAAPAEAQHTAIAAGTFFGRLIHDIRDLLAPVGNAAQLVRLHAAAMPQLLPATDIMERQIGRLCRLLDTLAVADKILKDDAVLPAAPVPLAAIVADAVRSARPAIDAGRHELQIDLPPPDVCVLGSAPHLAIAVAELVENAAAHSVDASRLWIDARTAGREVLVGVRDEGVGIAPERLPGLFELGPESRGPRADRVRPGLGVGLAMVRRIMALSGGSVEAASPGLGGGAVFTLRLPLVTASATDALAPVPPRPVAGSAQRPRRVLVVDDNRALQRSLVALIEELGGTATCADDGFEALGLVARWAPDVVMIDIHLPRLDGFGVARRLRGMPGPRPLLVMMSGEEFNATLRDEARAAGIDRCVAKLETGEFLRELLQP
ncbi:MAG: response regulator [Gammaproteobacteria bacterium]|nr:response regulator [Gammaproteobacteria bacterium]